MSKEDGAPSAIRENIKYLKRENNLKLTRRYATSSFYCVVTLNQPVLKDFVVLIYSLF